MLTKIHKKSLEKSYRQKKYEKIASGKNPKPDQSIGYNFFDAFFQTLITILEFLAFFIPKLYFRGKNLFGP